MQHDLVPRCLALRTSYSAFRSLSISLSRKGAPLLRRDQASLNIAKMSRAWA